MFYDKYLDFDDIEELYDNYDVNVLNNIDRDNFDKVYNLFKEYKFDFIEDIILKYFDIFILKYKDVDNKLNRLVKALGDNYIDIIGNDMSYLEYIVRD